MTAQCANPDASTPSGQLTGTVVRWFGHSGFIATPDTVGTDRGDYYVHQGDLLGASQLCVGDRVTFYSMTSERGLRAARVLQNARAAQRVHGAV